MPTTTEKINVVISAQDKTAGFSNIIKGIGGLKTVAIGAGIAVAGLAVKMGIDAVKAAASLEKSLGNVATLVDTGVESVKEMQGELLEMSTRVPMRVDDLADSLYNVRSAGIAAEGAMFVLEESAKLATAGLSSTEEATNVMTSAINAFGIEATDAGRVSDVFFKAVKAGKTTVSELSQGFGAVAPIANQLGVTFEDLLASTSAMTTSGLKASEAYTQIKGALSSMLKPTKEMQTAMDTVGISSENLSEIMSEKGLTGVFNMLSSSVDGNKSELAKMFGSVEGLNAVMMLLNDTGEVATGILNDMTEGENALNEAFKKQTKTVTAQWTMFKNQLNKILIELGFVILPTIVKWIKWVNEVGLPAAVEGWGKFTEAIKPAIEKIKEVVRWLRTLISVYNTIAAILGTGTLGENISGMARTAARTAANIVKNSSPIGRAGTMLGFAKGGVVPGPIGAPVPAIVHGGETVIPAGGSGGITLNISGNQFLDDNAAEMFGDKLIRILKQELKV